MKNMNLARVSLLIVALLLCPAAHAGVDVTDHATGKRVPLAGDQLPANSVGGDKLQDGAIDPAGSKFSGVTPISKGGCGATTAADCRSNLGLHDSATKDVGTGSGTVAAGDDPRITGAVQSAGGDASATKVIPTGAPSSITLAAHAAQQGVLLDSFFQFGDGDDTASMTRAVAADVPILLGPRTYIINNFSTGVVSRFVLKGVPGKSIIQRTSASGSGFFTVKAATVLIDGVTFDSNKAVVTANQWGVLINQGGQNIKITNSTFKNNSGTLGSCLSILSTGPAAGGWFLLDKIDVTGCTFNPLYLASVSNGSLVNSRIHDNTAGSGAYVSSYLAASSTNYATRISIRGNTFDNNTGPGLAVGGWGPPYDFSTNPPAKYITVEGNQFIDNTGYELSLQGHFLTALGNFFGQNSATPFGAIDCNSNDLFISSNVVNLSGASYGIDCGGSARAEIRNNRLTMDSGAVIDVGGNLNSVVSGNTLNLSGTANAIFVLNTEGDGAGSAFPQVTSGLSIVNNKILMNGSGTRGISIFDNAGAVSGAQPTTIAGNEFRLSNSASGFYAVYHFTQGKALTVYGNTLNGTGMTFVDPNGNGDIVFDSVYDEITGISSTSAVRSIINSLINAYGAGTSSGYVLAVYPTSGGANYTAATTITITGTGCTGWIGAPVIYGGSIIGVKTTTPASGCTAAAGATASDSGGGTGAVLAVVQGASLPSYKRIRWSSLGNLLQKGGGFVSLSNTSNNLQIAPGLVDLEALQSGVFWRISLPIAASQMQSKTSNYTIVSNDVGKHFDNVGASGEVDFTLPAAAVGLNFCVQSLVSQVVKWIPVGGDVIYSGASASLSGTGGGYVAASSAIGNSSCLEAHGSGAWITTSQQGSWTVH